jgi:hypothetical protein
VIPNEPIRPLHDVWLRPRRVFRAIATQPVGLADHLLGATQGVMNTLFYCRAADFGAKLSLAQIFGGSVVIGSVAGIVSLHVMAALYARLAARVGSPALRRQAVHVLAYSSVPVALSLGMWVVTALLAGEAAFVQSPGDVDGFIAILLVVQVAGYGLLALWAVVLQVMGFSEIMAIRVGKAFGIWVLGQLIAVLAILFLNVLVSSFLPSA